MTQNASDVEIANQGFAAFRQDLNDVLEDITTLHSGTAAPSTTYANQWWYETDTDKLYIRNEDNDAWIEILTLDQANDHLASLGASITLDGTGNVSIDSGDFTVDTDTLFVDASADAVGIGTSSPQLPLHVKGGFPTSVIERDAGTDSAASLTFTNSTTNGIYLTGSDTTFTVGHVSDYEGSPSYSERMRIDSSGNVGIGTSSPDMGIHLSSGGTNYLRVTNTSTGVGSDFGTSSTGTEIINRQAAPIRFQTNATERMRIDSSGNLLVGMTSGLGTFTNAGVGVSSSNYIHAVRDGNIPLFLGRKTSDGHILRTYKDGNISGAVGVFAGYPYFGHAGQSGAGLLYVSTSIRPFDVVTESQSDNDFDLGQISYRFDDIYATNGTIQTSDANEKQQIASLTAAEITAAKAISKLFKTFKWNDKVEAKGDAARTHAGVIAQDVQQAMADAGLDAGDYAFFISATWWETQTEVPAVEAVEAQDAVYDEDGNLVSEAVEAVEAKEAYTRTDSYDTADEAPEGATERTRLGIRYPELLSFIGAATEQRLADIETRLTALEAE